MGLFSKRTPVKIPEAEANTEEQAVIVYLGEESLSDEVYADYDIATLSDQLMEILQQQGLGEYDGEEMGPGGTILYIYSLDAERCFKAIERTLRAYPLCTNARVLIRQGGPGAAQREVRFSA